VVGFFSEIVINTQFNAGLFSLEPHVASHPVLAKSIPTSLRPSRILP
jgi:hypothetical protein